MNLDRVQRALSRGLRPALRTLTAGSVAAVCVVGLTAAPATTSATGPAHAPAGHTPAAPALDLVATSSSPAMGTSTYESRVLYYVNQKRKNHGLRALTLQSCTDGVAERWASHLASTGGFYHQSMSSVLKRCNARYAGETLGMGMITPATLVRMWMNSPEHRAILLSSKPRRIGIGSVPNAQGDWVTCANFTRF